MIDQTKDKKDDVLASKIEADKDQKQKTGLPQAMKDPAKVDPEKAQKLAQIEKEKAELSKAQKGADKLKEQAGNNASKAMQPIGSARVMQKAEVHSEPGKTGTRLTELSVQRQIDILAVQGDELKVLVDGKVGYVSAAQTDYAGAKKTQAKQEPQPIGSAKVAVSALRIRSAPGKDQNYIGTLREADKVNVYGEKDGYLEIRVGDQVGYISAEHTDYAGSQKKPLQPKDTKALDQAPAELQELLAKESLTAPEITTARNMIARCPESIRGDLYESLQAKPKMAEEKEDQKQGDINEFDALASSLELMGIQNPQTDKSFSAHLAELKRSQKLPEQGGMQNWGALANAMGVSYNALATQGDRSCLDKKFWSEMAREQIRDGHAVMACIDGQTVRIEAIEEDGLVVTLPDNSRVSLDSYSGKAEQKSKGKRGILGFDKLQDANMNWVIALG